MTNNLFNNRTHLIYLDGVNNKMLCLEIIFFCGVVKALCRLLNAVIQDIREAQEHRSRDILLRKFFNDVLQVNLYAILARRHVDVALFIYTKVTNAPTFYSVEFLGIINFPFLHCLQSV